MLGYVLISERGGAQTLFAQMVQPLRDAGIRPAGAIQTVNNPSEMTLRLLPSERLIKISQDLGPLATGCRLDADALESAVGEICEGLRGGDVDLLLINKFGKQEANGSGFIQAIELAMTCDIPVLIAVPSHLADAFAAWSGGAGTQLTPDTVLSWALKAAP